MAATNDTERRRRFVRHPTKEPNVTPRHIDMLRTVQRLRFARSTHVAALDGGSEQKVVRALRDLFDWGHLDRVPASGRTTTINEPMVYALGREGARLLAKTDNLTIDRLDWTGKNKQVGALFVEHTLMIADIIVHFELACRATDNIRFMDQNEVLALAPQATRDAREPFLWRADVQSPQGKRIPLGLYPDRAFSLVVNEEDRINFLLEADRGTMDVRPKDLWRTIERKTSIYKKLLTYHAGWKAKRHMRQFGWQKFRVMFVTTSRQRADNMVTAVQKMTDGRGSGLFLFADETILIARNPFEYQWVNGRQERTRLVED